MHHSQYFDSGFLTDAEKLATVNMFEVPERTTQVYCPARSVSKLSILKTEPFAVLLTKDPVQFITHPQDYVLDGHGSPISLNCRATGLSCFGQDDCPNYGWLQDGKTVPASDYSNTANGSVLRIDNFETDRAGQYTCVVRSGTSNMFTVASFSASVRNPLSKYCE